LTVGREEGADCGVGVAFEAGIRAACIVSAEHDLVHRDPQQQSDEVVSSEQRIFEA
jgi:hypothetical protein